MEAREDERESEMLEDFASAEIQTGETTIFVRSHGSGPPLLLLHGFPQTHVMWRGVAPRLARDFTVVCADLRGYGHSGCPVSTPDHAPSSVAGHDRVIDDALGGWGSPSAAFPLGVRAAYVQALRDPAHAHAICEEYRAAATVDREHDKADRARGRRIICPLLVLWSARGALGTWYVEESGPISLWRAWSDEVQGHPLDAAESLGRGQSRTSKPNSRAAFSPSTLARPASERWPIVRSIASAECGQVPSWCG